jgi:membrane protein DedA with SNARE-associated domain
MDEPRLDQLTSDQLRDLREAMEQEMTLVPKPLVVLSTICMWPQLVILVMLGILASKDSERLIWNVSVLAAGSFLEMIKSIVLFRVRHTR